MAKVDTFIEQLEATVETLGTTDSLVKAEVGDSIFNHRTISVSQLIRFLLNSSKRSERNLGESLNVVYSMIRPALGRVRREVFENSRTDAYDYSEFINLLRYYQSDRGFRKAAGRVL